MPKTRFDKKPRDPLKELVLGRKATLGMTNTELAERMSMTRSQLDTMFRKPSDQWRIAAALSMASALDIPIAETRDVISRVQKA